MENRRYQRALLDVPVEFEVKGGGARGAGTARDISLGGMFIETASPIAFNSPVVVYLTIPRHPGPLAFPGIVRWAREGGMGIQFSLLGARETHAITEHTRAKSSPGFR